MKIDRKIPKTTNRWNFIMDFKAVRILIKKDYVLQIWCSDVFLVTESDEMKKKFKIAAKFTCDVIKGQFLDFSVTGDRNGL